MTEDCPACGCAMERSRRLRLSWNSSEAGEDSGFEMFGLNPNRYEATTTDDEYINERAYVTRIECTECDFYIQEVKEK